MAKKVSKKAAEKETVKTPKKVRTPEQKAQRKLRRAQRKANVAKMAPIKEKANAAIGTPVPVVSMWEMKKTSDGLPFSKSIDNPDSLISQLKRMEENAAAEKAKKAEAGKVALEDFRTPRFAGLGKMDGQVIEF
jgi:hypothetical protein